MLGLTKCAQDMVDDSGGCHHYNIYVTAIASVILSLGKLVPMLFATPPGVSPRAHLLVSHAAYGVGAAVLSVVGYKPVNMW
jgi:hypothetical protein